MGGWVGQSQQIDTQNCYTARFAWVHVLRNTADTCTQLQHPQTTAEWASSSSILHSSVDYCHMVTIMLCQPAAVGHVLQNHPLQPCTSVAAAES
jgi:hypothetical protein